MSRILIRRWPSRIGILCWLCLLVAIGILWIRSYYRIDQIERVGGQTDLSFTSDAGGLWIQALWCPPSQWFHTAAWYRRTLSLELSEHDQPTHAGFYYERQPGNEPAGIIFRLPFWALLTLLSTPAIPPICRTLRRRHGRGFPLSCPDPSTEPLASPAASNSEAHSP